MDPDDDDDDNNNNNNNNNCTFFRCPYYDPSGQTLISKTHTAVLGNLVVPFVGSAAMQTRSFSIIGSTTWNGLSIDLRRLSNGICSQFHHLLKTVLFRLTRIGSASE